MWYLRQAVLNHLAKCLLLSSQWTWKKRATLKTQIIQALKVSKVDYLLNNKKQNNILFNKKTTFWMISKKKIYSPIKIRLEVLVLSLLQIKLTEKSKISSMKIKLTILYSKKVSLVKFQIRLGLIPDNSMLNINHKHRTSTIFLCLSDYVFLCFHNNIQ